MGEGCGGRLHLALEASADLYDLAAQRHHALQLRGAEAKVLRACRNALSLTLADAVRLAAQVQEPAEEGKVQRHREAKGDREPPPRPTRQISVVAHSTLSGSKLKSASKRGSRLSAVA